MATAPLRPCPVPHCSALVPVGRCPDHARAQARSRPNRDVRRWYYTARWVRLRQQVLTEALQMCVACRRVVLELDVDHVIPHHGDARLFWALNNLQALCKTCHSSKTQRGE